MLYGRGLDTLELLGDLHWGGHRTDPMPSKLCAGAPMSSRSDGAYECKGIAAPGGVANCQAWRSVPSQGGPRAIHAHRRCARPPHAPADDGDHGGADAVEGPQDPEEPTVPHVERRQAEHHEERR